MTPESQRIAIAEQLPDLVIISQREPIPILLWKNRSYNVDFDPLNDLNAMHEAEKVIGPKQKPYYCSELWNFTELWDLTVTPNSNHEWKMCHATAAQRAEAFLRTLGLWTD